MKLPGNLGELDWTSWFGGMWSAIISGGTTALLSSTYLTFTDSKDFRYDDPKLWKLMGGLFLWAGFWSFINYIHNHTKPEMKTTTAVMQQTSTTPGGVVTQTKVEQKVVEPAPPVVSPAPKTEPVAPVQKENQ